jgi:hypothetical protein
LDGTPVTDAGIVHLKGLPNLNHLTLSNTAISDKGLLQLEQLPKLKEVSIDGTRISYKVRAQLQEARPDLRIHGHTTEPAPRAQTVKEAPVERE